jgi:hypothetical protein
MNQQIYTHDKFTIDELFNRSLKFRNSAEFLKFFSFIAKFEHYARYNAMLVYLQNDAVTFFGSSTYWYKRFNRIVKDEARPYIILQPFGPVMLVYDIFDTEGELSPEEFLEKGLGRKPLKVIGKVDHNIYSHAVKVANDFGIPVLIKPMSYFKGGHVTTVFKGVLEICLKEENNITERFSTLLHELAHLFLGHTGFKELTNKKKKNNLLRRDLPRSVEELEAETVSFLITDRMGLKTQSAEYLAGYIISQEDLESFSYELVIKTADKIEEMFIKKNLRANL